MGCKTKRGKTNKRMTLDGRKTFPNEVNRQTGAKGGVENLEKGFEEMIGDGK